MSILLEPCAHGIKTFVRLLAFNLGPRRIRAIDRGDYSGPTQLEEETSYSIREDEWNGEEVSWRGSCTSAELFWGELRLMIDLDSTAYSRNRRYSTFDQLKCLRSF